MINEARLLTRCLVKGRLVCGRKFTTTTNSLAYQKSFKTCIGATNPIIDGPDFSYKDGRPAPLLTKQKQRAIDQKKLVEKAFAFMKEIDFAVERYNNMTQAEKEERQKIIKSKFKEKNLKES